MLHFTKYLTRRRPGNLQYQCNIVQIIIVSKITAALTSRAWQMHQLKWLEGRQRLKVNRVSWTKPTNWGLQTHWYPKLSGPTELVGYCNGFSLFPLPDIPLRIRTVRPAQKKEREERLCKQHFNLLQFAMVDGAGTPGAVGVNWCILWHIYKTCPAPCNMQHAAGSMQQAALSAGALAALGWVVLGQRTL